MASSPAIKLILWLQNCLYSYVGECQSNFAKIESSSEGWLSNLGLGKLSSTTYLSQTERSKLIQCILVVSGVKRRGKAAAESLYWQCKAIVLVAHTPVSRSRLLAASTKESGAWLNALPVSSLGLRMDKNTVRIAVGLLLGSPFATPTPVTTCGVQVDGTATYGLSCKWSEGHHQRHATVNDIVHRAMSAAYLPSRLEPSGLSRSDGKRLDGVTLVPWRSGRLLMWDATCPDTFSSPTYQVSPKVQWQPWLSGASRRNTQPSTNATTSYLLGQRLSCSRENWVAISNRSPRKPSCSPTYLRQRLFVAAQWGSGQFWQ